jgi:hypothetical protein
MNRTCLRLAAAAAGLVFVVTGCMGPSSALVPPELTGAAKIAGGEMSTLTGQEILALSGAASDLSGALGVEIPSDFDLDLTMEQADALAEFLSLNQLNTVDDVKALVETAIEEPGSVAIPDGLIEIFLPDVQPQTVSAVQKLSEGEISSWTADEVQSLALEVGELDPDEEPVPLTDEQSQAIVDFIVLNDIDTLADWQAVAENPETAELPDGAEDLFAGL